MKPIAENRALSEENVKGNEKILDEARERFKEALDFESENRDLAEDDIRFLHGDQWPEEIVLQRKNDARPCLTFNKLDQRVDQVVGDQRQAKPGIYIHPAENNTDKTGKNFAGTKDLALSEVMNGLIRAIEQNSNAEIAYNTAFAHAVGHGFGYWRVLTEWDESDPFNQVIRIRRIKNAFSVYFDPLAQDPTGSDGNWCFVASMVNRKAFERQYPNADSTNWSIEGSGDTYNQWYEGDNIRVVEYFRRVPVKKLAIKLSDGRVSYIEKDDLPELKERLLLEGLRITDQKEQKVPTVQWFKMSARDILDKGEFPSFYLPVVRVLGKELNVNGYDFYRGIIRHAKGAQQTYNYNRTSQVEQTALQPKAPMMATPEQIEAHEVMWKNMNKANTAYILYNHVEGVPPPIRQPSPLQSTGHQINALSDDNDIDATTGLYKASLGAPSNEKSGRAIRERKMEGDVGTFTFHSNFQIALKQTGRILVDMIPRIYDTQRVVRIVTPEEEDDFVELNSTYYEDDGIGGTKKIRIHDLAAGRYDVRVTSGPSYTTLREEARESMVDFAKALPQIAPLIADLIAENMDWPKANVISERLKKTLPPGVADQEGEGDPELQNLMMQLEQAAQQAQQLQAQVEAMAKEKDTEVRIKQLQLESDRVKAEATRIKAEADLRKAEIDANQRGAESQANIDAVTLANEEVQEAMAMLVAEVIKSNAATLETYTKTTEGFLNAASIKRTERKKVEITAPSGQKYKGEIIEEQ